MQVLADVLFDFIKKSKENVFIPLILIIRKSKNLLNESANYYLLFRFF